MLTAIALRTAAVQALKGATLAGDLVFDGASRLPDSDKDEPRFAVVVETGEVRENVLPVTFTLWIYQRAVVAEDACGWQAAPIDGAAGMVLDVLTHQIRQRLTRGEAWGWVKAFRDLCAYKDFRTLPDHDELAMRVIALDVTPIAEPAEWQSPGQGWLSFKEEIEAGGVEFAPVRAAIAAALGGAPDWSAIGLGCGVKVADIPAALAEYRAAMEKDDSRAAFKTAFDDSAARALIPGEQQAAE